MDQKKLSLISLAFLAFALFEATAAKNDDKPNIVLIMAEDISNDLECYGTPAVQAPTLDRMAGEGIKYNPTYAQVRTLHSVTH